MTRPIVLKGDEARLWVELAEANNTARVKAHIAAKRRKQTPHNRIAGRDKHGSSVPSGPAPMPWFFAGAIAVGVGVWLLAIVGVMALVKRITG